MLFLCLFYLVISQTLLTSTSESKSHKAANQFGASKLYFPLPSNLFNFLRLKLSALNDQTLSTLECLRIYIRIWSIWLWMFPSGDVQSYLWMLRCRNIVLSTLRFLDVAKFTTLTPLSLLISSKLSFSVVSFHMVFREYIEHILHFLIETVTHINNFILCWGMNVQNNDMTLATS
jgi:hypothetical protein